MANPIKKIASTPLEEQKNQDKEWEELQKQIVENKDAVLLALKTLEELEKTGFLHLVEDGLKSKNEISVLALQQLLRPEVITFFNNAKSFAGAITQWNPDLSHKIMGALSEGVESGQHSVEFGSDLGMFDLIKALKDPEVNRSLRFAIGFLKGFGKKM